jgi:hypothetical protein
LHKSNIEQQHRPILDQLPADWIYDRDNGETFQHPCLLGTSIDSAGLHPSLTAIDLIGPLRCVHFSGFAGRLWRPAG